MTSAIWLLTAGAGLLLFLRAAYLHRNRAIRREWEVLLTPEGLRSYRQLKASIALDLETAGYSYDQALKFREQGSVDGAIRLLRAGCEVIRQAAPDRLRLLAGMAVYSRMVAAMLPMPILAPGRFRLRSLSGLAALASVLHHLVVTTMEQFRIRLWVLRQGFRIVPRVVGDSTGRVEANRAPSGADWERILAGHADFRMLSDESLESFRVLVTALCAEHRDQVVVSWPAL